MVMVAQKEMGGMNRVCSRDDSVLKEARVRAGARRGLVRAGKLSTYESSRGSCLA